jgi:hypothetical protein
VFRLTILVFFEICSIIVTKTRTVPLENGAKGNKSFSDLLSIE